MSPQKSDSSKGRIYKRDSPTVSDTSDYQSAGGSSYSEGVGRRPSPRTPSKRQDHTTPLASPFVSQRRKDKSRQESPSYRPEGPMVTPKANGDWPPPVASDTSISTAVRRGGTPKSKTSVPALRSSPLSQLNVSASFRSLSRENSASSACDDRLFARIERLKLQPTVEVTVTDSEDEEGGDTESVSSFASTDVDSDTSSIPTRENSLEELRYHSNTTSLTSMGSQPSSTEVSDLRSQPTASGSGKPPASYATRDAEARPYRVRPQEERARSSPNPASISYSSPSSAHGVNTPTKRDHIRNGTDPFASPSTSSASTAGKSSSSMASRGYMQPEPSPMRGVTPSTPTRSRTGPNTSYPLSYQARSASNPFSRNGYLPQASVSTPPRSNPPPAVTLPTQSDAAVKRFLSLRLGTLLQPYLIAYDRKVVALFDYHQIHHGIQWQLARGVTKGYWTWDDIAAKIDFLKGRLEEIGPRVAHIMLTELKDIQTEVKIWAELAREQEAIMEGIGRGLGLMGEWEGVRDWYGGRVQQLARLIEKDGELKVVLEPLEMRRSHRFARFLGSRRMLQLRIPAKLLQEIPDKIREFVARKFILLGRTFVPFHVKDGSVYMAEINADYERVPQDWCGDQHRLSFVQFMEWHNPMALNKGQAISKFVTRYALGLSNTVPVLEFAPENIFFIDDINASDVLPGEKAPTEKIMTDGCGFINLAALTAITRVMGYEYTPTAIQARIDGSKGLWVRHPSDKSEDPKIWIRASQNKIKNPELDRAHRILELVGPSKASTSIALSQQSILNLFYNGVPGNIIIELFREGLQDEISALLDWSDMLCLANVVSKAGGIPGARLARLTAGGGRALGLERAQWRADDVENSEDSEEDLDEPTTYTGRNPYSGAPLSIHEATFELLQAEFRPENCDIVQSKIKQIGMTLVDTAVEKYRIPLGDSVAAWLIPDPYATPENPEGILEEGQIYFKSSTALKDPESELAYHVITGEVILGRYPMRLPSDLQKATAVDLQEFALYTDVVIVSVRGKVSLPSLLSGGDMDGDIVNIFRSPELVRHFVSKPLTEEPRGLKEATFVKQVVSVTSFCEQSASMEPAAAQKWYSEFLLSDVISVQKGLYSMFHDNAVANYGYDHPKTIRLAYIFNALLDASKTGLKLLDGIFDKDKSEYGSKPAPFHILQDLRDEGTCIKKAFLEKFDNAVLVGPERRNAATYFDPDLRKPYEDVMKNIRSHEGCADEANRRVLANPALKTHPEVVELCNRAAIGKMLHDEIRAIRNHVDAARRKFCETVAKSKGADESPSKAKAKSSYGTSKSDQSDQMYAAAKLYSSDLAVPTPFYASQLQELKASYAYCQEFNGTGKFPWAVAFRDLCLIKAKARGNIAPTTRKFDEAKTVSSSVVKVLTKAGSDKISF